MSFNPAVFSIRNRLLILLVIIGTIVAGMAAYGSLPRFEDPEFTIRRAVVVTPYPGGSPMEVATEVTQRLEREIGQMQEVKEIVSTSEAGQSRIEVEIKYEFGRNKEQLQIVWTKLRNRVADAARLLPPGAGPSIVNDDFGDVFGIFYMLTADGYSPAELYDYAEKLRTDLSGVEGVGKVVLSGEQREAFYVEIMRERVAALGLSVQSVYQDLAQQNSVVAAGSVRVGDQRLEIVPTGEIDSVEELRDLPVMTGQEGAVVRLGDLARVTRGYVDPPMQILRYNGRPAVGMGISNATGTNVVEVGEAIEAKLRASESDRPIGIEIHEFYHQGKVVSDAIGDFVINVATALVIVVVTLLIFMGWRSAVVIGAVLMLTVAATLAGMNAGGIPMHRISLGALIIALGMMVDNAIVVVEGMLVGLKQGKNRLEAARAIVGQMLWPLLGGTLVGIIAFAPIGLAPGQVAEYTNHLFWVVMISLLFSWFFAVTVAPFLANWLFEKEEDAAASGTDRETGFDAGHDGLEDEAAPQREAGRIGTAYREWLARALRHRWRTMGLTGGLFAVSLVGFAFVEQGFFPASTTPHLMVDYWLPAGTDIERTNADLEEIEEDLATMDGVTDVQTVVGMGTLRYKLVYQPEAPTSSFGQMILRVEDASTLERLQADVHAYLQKNAPEARAKVWLFELGPGGGSKIEAQFSGPDPAVLQSLAQQAKDVFAEDEAAILVKDDWREQVPVIHPLYSETRARRLGVSREDVAEALQGTFAGRPIGVFREGDDLIPIIARSPESETRDAQNMEAIQVFSASGASLPLQEVIDGFETRWRHSQIQRIDQRWAINAQADPAPGETANRLLDRVRGDIEAIELPSSYHFEWDGQEGTSTEAIDSLIGVVPLGVIGMVLVVIVLFNAVRQPVIIFMIVPLAIIGVTIGLLITGIAMEFIAILGVLSLSGLLIKNAIVLVDQMDIEIGEGKPRFDAIIEAAYDRARPVILSSLTTVLGVIPLLFDAFFKAMAVVLAFGLAFGTVLTLFVVPVLYAIFFKIGPDETAAEPQGAS